MYRYIFFLQENNYNRNKQLFATNEFIKVTTLWQ